MVEQVKRIANEFRVIRSGVYWAVQFRGITFDFKCGPWQGSVGNQQHKSKESAIRSMRAVINRRSQHHLISFIYNVKEGIVDD